MLPFEADLDAVFMAGPFAVVASYNGEDARVLFDDGQSFQTDLGGQILSVDQQSFTVPTALVTTGAWAGLAVEQSITLDAKTYRVRSLSKQGDGATTSIVVVAA
jgi:hypothetical protein